MSYRARKIDDNQTLLVKGLRLAGGSVTSTAMVGNGFPDVCVGTPGGNMILEVKDPLKSPSERALTPAEVQWHLSWKGPKAVVETVVQAIEVCGLPPLSNDQLIKLALDEAKGETDQKRWVKKVAQASRVVGIAVPFSFQAPSPPPQVAKKRGPFRRKGKGTVSPQSENLHVGRTPTEPLLKHDHDSGWFCVACKADEDRVLHEPISMRELLLHELDEQERAIDRLTDAAGLARLP